MNIEVKDIDSNVPMWAKISLVIISYIIMSGLFQFIGMVILEIPFYSKDMLSEISMIHHLVLQIFTSGSLIVVVYIFRKYVDKKSIRSLGLTIKNRFNDVGLGFLFPLFIIGTGTCILQFLDYLSLIYVNFDFVQLLLGFCLFVFVSLNEEVLIRGYILNNLLDSVNKYLALMISALIFSSLHTLNSNLTLIAFVNLFLAGIFLGSAYIFTRNLWFSISLHLFWNFIQGSILGFSVSGQKIDSLFFVKDTGNKTISGGEFGFEGSVLCSVLLVFAIFIVFTFHEFGGAKARRPTTFREPEGQRAKASQKIWQAQN